MSSPASSAAPRRVRFVTGAVVEVLQAADAEVVSNRDAGEAELLPEQVGQELVRAVQGEAVDLVVGRHDGADARLVDDGAERRRNDVAQVTRTHGGPAPVEATVGRAVAQKVLGGGDDALCLHAPHVGDAHAAGQLGIFAVGLLEPAPAGVTGDVEDRRQRQSSADSPELATDHCRRSARPAPGPRWRRG